MAEVWTLSEESIRKLAKLVSAQERELSNLRRHLAHYSTRRHEAVYLPSKGGVKIVNAKNVIYASFGGGGSDDGNFIDYGSADTNALAISTGNYVPLTSGSLATQRRKLVYPRTCYLWELDSDNVLQQTSTEISVINFGGLPIPITAQLAVQKLEGTDYYVPIQKPSDICRDGKLFLADVNISLDGDGTPKIVRADWQHGSQPSLSGANATTDFAHTEDYDVFLHHPGVYAVTFGMNVQRVSSDTADDKQYTDSGGDTVDIPTTMHFTGELFRNYNPASGNISTQFGTLEQIAVSVGPGDSSPVTVERTVMLTHTLDTWHGQPYMRLSFAAKCNGGGPDAASASGKINECWILIRPMGGAGYNEGSGYNVFLGTSGAFQWWGGGSAPGILFDADGV